MQLQLDSNENIEAIVTVCDDYIDTRKTRLKASFLITPETVIAHWRPKRAIDIRAADLEALLATSAEIYLVGTGPDQYFPQALELQSFIRVGKTGLPFLRISKCSRGLPLFFFPISAISMPAPMVSFSLTNNRRL